MKKYTVIIPVHQWDDKTEEMLSEAINSAKNDDADIKVVGPADVTGKVGKVFKVGIIENNNATDFCSQVNTAVESVETEWFTVLEMDDTLTSNYFKMVNDHISAYPDVSVLLPLVLEVNSDKKFIRFMNEGSWSKALSVEELGVLNVDALKEYPMFSIPGAMIRVVDFKEVGGLKKNIKFSFNYELLLRLVENGKKTISMNQVGYIHLNFREGSYHYIVSKEMGSDEQDRWYDIAREEYMYKFERDIK